jgi:hypothetical protein
VFINILYGVWVLEHFWTPNVACYTTEDAVRIGILVLLQFHSSSLQLITIIYYAVTHWHSLQSYTPIFHSWYHHIFTIGNLTANCMPPHSLRNWTVKSKSHCDWRSVSQSVSLDVEPHLGLMTRYLVLFDSYGLVCFFFAGRPLWRKGGSVFCQSHCLH